MEEKENYSVGFNVLRVGMKRFNLYVDLSVVDFDAPFITIEGPTGSGKSSVLEAITYAIYGRTMRMETGYTLDQVCKVGGYCFVEFEKNENIYYVKRGRKQSGTNTDTHVDLMVNGERVHGKTMDLDLELKRIMGMDFLGFISSSLIRQGELQMFNMLSPAQRLTRMMHLFNLTVFEKAIKRAKEERKAILHQITGIRGETDGISKIVESESSMKESLGENSREIMSFRAKKQKMDDKVSALETVVNGLRERKETVAGLLGKKDELERQIQSLRNEKSDLLSRISALKGKIEVSRMESMDTDAITIMKESVESLSGLIQERESMEKAIQSRNEYIETREGKYRELLEKYSGGISIDEFMDYCKRLGVMEIKNPFDLPSRKEVSRKKEECVSGVVSKVIKEEIVGDFDGDDAMEGNLEAIVTRIGTMFDSLGGITIEEAVAKVEKALDVEKDLEGFNSEMEQLVTKRDDVQAKIKAKTIEIDGLNEQIGDGTIQQKLESAEAELESARSDDAFLHGKISELMGSSKTIREKIKEIKEYKKIVADNKSKIKELEGELDLIGESVDNILDKKGVPMYGIRRIIGSVELRASEILNFMTTGKKKMIAFEISKSGKGIEVYTDGLPASGASGGEKTQINASIRFAIAEKMTEMGTLFMDEPNFGSLDNHTELPRFMESIFNSIHFQKIVLITHMTDITDQFDKHVRIEKTADVSKVVEN